MKSTAYILLALLLAACTTKDVTAAASHEIRWADEYTDTARLDSILTAPAITSLRSQNARVEAIGRAFLGKPYVAATLEGSPEMLTINTSELDCTTFVELVAATALCMDENATSWRAVADKLSQMRYRAGKPDGYASRLHYIADWINHNRYLGLISDVTADMGTTPKSVTKTLDFMTSNRHLYPALADSAEFARIKDTEAGLRSIRYDVLPTAVLSSKKVIENLRAGDIVFLTLTNRALDVGHAGIIVKDDKGLPHLMHASSSAGKVVIEPLPLADYLRKIKRFDGIRVVRLRP